MLHRASHARTTLQPAASAATLGSDHRIQTRTDLESAFDQTASFPGLLPGDGNLVDNLAAALDALTNSTISGAAPSRESSSGSSGSSLPDELLRLTDAAAPVQLPPPGRIPPTSLDNRDLDKLVAQLGRNKATWRRALVLYEWLQESHHTLDDRLCTTLIRVCADHGQAVSALSVYEWMRAPVQAGGGSLRPTVYTYTAAMRAALAAGMLDKALRIWDDAQAARCKPDCRMCITYIEACSRQGLVDRALQMYNQMKDEGPSSRMAPTVHAFTAAMRAATEGGRWQKALEIWGDMKQAGCQPTGHAFAAVISACAAGQDWLRAVALFEEMCDAGIRPDVVSCTALVTALAAAGQWQRAESVVQWMLGCGLKPNVRTYTALLTALGNAKQWARAVEMLSLMQTPEWGAVQPNAYTYSALLKALGDHGLWQLADQVFGGLELELLGQRSGPAGSSPGSNAIVMRQQPQQHMGASWGAAAVPAAVASGTVAAAAAAAAAPASMHAMANSLINAAWPAAAIVGDELPATASATAVPRSEWTSPSELNGLNLSLKPPVGAANDFSLFSVQPTPVAAGVDDASSTGSTSSKGSSSIATAAALTALQQQASQSTGLEALSAALTSELVAHQLAQLAAFHSYSPGHNFLHNTEQLPAPQASSTIGSNNGGSRAGGNSVAPAKSETKLVNEVVCGALMLAFERVGKWQEAVGVLDRARSLGVTPNTVMYNTAISAAGKAGQLELAQHLFQEVHTPDAVTFETLIAAYGMAGNAPRAEALFRQMLQAGFRPRDYAYCGLIAGYSMAGNWQAALRVRQRMRRDRVHVSVHVYNALIAACERCGQLEKALELFHSMQRERLEGNAVTQQLMASIGKKGAASVEGQQVAAAALTAVMAAAGTMLVRTGIF